MRRFQVRFTVRWLMVAVAIVAGGLAVWSSWFDPTRRWQRAIRDDQNGALRWQAVNEMTQGKGIDPATALATLTDALRSPSPRIRESAVVGLGRLGPAARPALGSLLATFADPQAQIRALAARQLMAILPPGDPGRAVALPALKRLLSDRSIHVRLMAAFVLADFGHGMDGLPVLIEALRRSDYRAQTDALWALGWIGPSARDVAFDEVVAVETRAKAIAAPDIARYLRIYGARTRYLLGDRDAAYATLQTLSADGDADLAREAQRILAEFPGPSATDPG